MTHFFSKLFARYPIKTKRFLELMPGLTSWTLIFSPVWGPILFPNPFAFFILFFDVYWFYKSFSLMITAHIASNKIRVAEKIDWVTKAKELENFNKISHVVVIPNYKENISKLRESIQTIANQTLSPKKIFVVLAMEKREPEAKDKANEIIKEFKDVFGDIFGTYHPDVSGELKGKSSNQSYGAHVAYEKLFVQGNRNITYATISSVDADSLFDKNYFAYLSYKFLADPNRFYKFWQSANVNYNNFWKVPAPIRVIAFFGSLWRTGVLIQKDRLISNSTYSLSFDMLRFIGFWDTDVVPEDYRVFFKAFFMLEGKVSVEPIFLKTSMDAAHSHGYMASLINKYNQERRWSWGVSDDPLFIKWWFTVPNVPFVRKTVLLFNVLLDHFLWPVNWFIITVAANVVPIVNPEFSRTALGYSLPRLAGFILTSCLISLFIMIIIDFRNRRMHEKFSKTRQLLLPFEFIILPLVGFALSTVPAIISHTQLMLGKRLEYKVTEKL